MIDRPSDAGAVAGEDAAREARRRARAAWPIRRFEQGAEPSDDLSASSAADERLSMVWALTLLSWRLAGRAIPEYTRAAMPGRVVRASASDRAED